MNCEQAEDLITRFVTGELTDDEEKLALDGHTATCEHCHEFMGDIKVAASLLHDAAEAEPEPKLSIGKRAELFEKAGISGSEGTGIGNQESGKTATQRRRLHSPQAWLKGLAGTAAALVIVTALLSIFSNQIRSRFSKSAQQLAGATAPRRVLGLKEKLKEFDPGKSEKPSSVYSGSSGGSGGGGGSSSSGGSGGGGRGSSALEDPSTTTAWVSGTPEIPAPREYRSSRIEELGEKGLESGEESSSVKITLGTGTLALGDEYEVDRKDGSGIKEDG
ncbi:MAG: zf-HC2 domain-containing protein, partial [Planctomycetota bacterium]|nr:zf-HC2 domain-containing protein [Planctomycetota bacterium]